MESSRPPSPPAIAKVADDRHDVEAAEHQRRHDDADGDAEGRALVDTEDRLGGKRIARDRLQGEARETEVDADETGNEHARQAQVDHGRAGEAAVVHEQQLQDVADAHVLPLADGQRQQRCCQHRCRHERIAKAEGHYCARTDLTISTRLAALTSDAMTPRSRDHSWATTS
jgi:hypothetical protein